MPSRSGTEVGGARLKEKFLVRINSGGKIFFLSYNIKKQMYVIKDQYIERILI